MTDEVERKAVAVEEALEGFVCPSRSSSPSFHLPAHDRWDKRPNGDKTCSFCGSWNYEELQALLPSVDGEQVHVEIADRRHKIYVRRPGVKNASEGAIKFYLYHGPPKGDLFWQQLDDAVKLSHEVFMRNVTA